MGKLSAVRAGLTARVGKRAGWGLRQTGEHVSIGREPKSTFLQSTQILTIFWLFKRCWKFSFKEDLLIFKHWNVIQNLPKHCRANKIQGGDEFGPGWMSHHLAVLCLCDPRMASSLSPQPCVYLRPCPGALLGPYFSTAPWKPDITPAVRDAWESEDGAFHN